MKKQKGITLIALVITIIVMLILVAVSVTVALRGGLFSAAKQAATGTQLRRDEEMALSNGRVKIGNVWYDSMDDYLNNNPSGNQENTSVGDSGTGDTGNNGGTQGGGNTPTTPDPVPVPDAPKVGDYVNYVPDTATYEGYTTETGDNALEWRILSINEATGVVELISATVGQAQGVVLDVVEDDRVNGDDSTYDKLNTICNSIYSKTAGENVLATARNIIRQDVNDAGAGSGLYALGVSYVTAELYGYNNGSTAALDIYIINQSGTITRETVMSWTAGGEERMEYISRPIRPVVTLAADAELTFDNVKTTSADKIYWNIEF